MDELDNKALNATETPNRTKQFMIAFGVICLLLAILMTKCGKNKGNFTTPREQHLIDSINFIRAIEKKQAGKEIAILLNENTQLQKDKMILKQEKDSIKQHERQLIATNTNLIKKMRETAPKECQPYIDSCDEYHKQIELSKDNAYNKQAEELCKSEESNTKLMQTIGIKDVEAAKDSMNYAKNMKVKDIEIDQAHKQTKRTKFWGKLAIGAAVVWTGVVMYVTVVK